MKCQLWHKRRSKTATGKCTVKMVGMVGKVLRLFYLSLVFPIVFYFPFFSWDLTARVHGTEAAGPYSSPLLPTRKWQTYLYFIFMIIIWLSAVDLSNVPLNHWATTGQPQFLDSNLSTFWIGFFIKISRYFKWIFWHFSLLLY